MVPEKSNIVPSEFIIVGGTGNLSKNKILPALFWRFLDNQIDAQSNIILCDNCLLYTSPSPRDLSTCRMPSSA